MFMPPRSEFLNITVRPRIGDLGVQQFKVTAGGSIEDYAREIGEALPLEFWATGCVVIDDGEPIPVERWRETRPKTGQCIAFHSGYGKGGNTLQIVATIAVVAAQAFAYMIPGVGPFVSAAIGIGGSFLIAALAPKPGGAGGKKAPKQLGDAGFSSNLLPSYEQVATVLGSRRVPAPYLCPPYVELNGEQAYGTGVIGLAGHNEMEDAFINGAPAEVITERYAHGDESDHPTSIVTQIVWQEPGKEFTRFSMDNDATNDERWNLFHNGTSADVLAYDLPKWQTFRLGKKGIPKKVIFDILMPQGLVRSNDERCATAYQIKLSKKFNSDIYLPILVCVAKADSPIRFKIVVNFYETNIGGGGVSGSFFRATFANSVAQQNTDQVAISDQFGSGASTSTSCEAISEAEFHYDLEPENIPDIGAGGWNISIRQGCGAFDNRMDYTANEYAYNGGADEAMYWFNPRANGSTRTMEDQAKCIAPSTLLYCTRIFDENPINNEGFSLYEFQVQNSNVETATVKASKWVRERWTGSTWKAEPVISSNAGELARDIMKNDLKTLNSRPLSTDIIDDDDLGALADFCKTYDLRVDAYIPNGSVEDALATCFTSVGAYMRRNKKWGCYIEKSRAGEDPVQIYTPRNSDNFVLEKTFDHRPHALIVTFDDEEDDYQTRPNFIVYADGYNADGSGGLTAATLFDSIDLRGVVREWQAEYIARLALRIPVYRDKQYTLNTDARWLASPRGSLVGVSHYVLNTLHGFAAIREVRRNVVGGVTKITGLLLDGHVDMVATTTGFAITSKDAELITAQSVQPGRVKELVFSTPLDDNLNVVSGCTLSVGEVGEEYDRMIVDDIRPAARSQAQLVLFDEAPLIHA